MIGAIIQARIDSIRLPGKVLAEACGKPLLVHMIERLKLCKTLDKIVVATPYGDENRQIQEVAFAAGAGYFANSGIDENDVLSRVLTAAQNWLYDLIVELTADCPLIDPAIVDLAVREFQQNACDFASTTRDARPAGNSEPAFPRGMDVRVFPRSVLEEVDQLTQDSRDREHVSLYVWQHPERFRCRWIPAPAHLADDVRLTVDEPADLELVRAIFEMLYPAKPEFDLADILALLNERPELREINRHVQQKEVR